MAVLQNALVLPAISSQGIPDFYSHFQGKVLSFLSQRGVFLSTKQLFGKHLRRASMPQCVYSGLLGATHSEDSHGYR